MSTAIAHPNIALIKYWGKQPRDGNYPVTPNLSITLSELATTTTVEDHDTDELWLDGSRTQDSKVMNFLAALRNQHPFGPIKISTHNNFPTGAGLASSASGFAALITAIDDYANLSLSPTQRSRWARQGSASAARSIFSGFVGMAPPDWDAYSIAPPEHWPLNTVVAVTSSKRKLVSSTDGMQQSKLTSPYFDTWVQTSHADYAQALNTIAEKNFASLAELAELSCLKMHSVMLTTRPTLAYWNPASVACMERIRNLRSDGVPVFFTMDAGPQVKAICEPAATEQVANALRELPGVQQILSCAMGPAAFTTHQRAG